MSHLPRPTPYPLPKREGKEVFGDGLWHFVPQTISEPLDSPPSKEGGSGGMGKYDIVKVDK
jgi:hypothetical protein